MSIFPRILFWLNQRASQKEVNNEYEERNYRLALLNGILIRVAFRFVNSSMILAAFVKQLTNSNIMVGLTSSAMGSGSVWPQLIMSNILEHRPRKMPFYILGASLRVTCWFLIMLLTFFLGNKNHLTLFVLFYVLYFVSNSAMGISIIPFQDIIAKSIPVKKRARLFSLRALIGGGFGVLAGFLIKYILSEDFFLSFPYNYGFMFGLCAVMMTASSTSFIISKEPIQEVRKTRRPFWEHLKRGPRFLRNDPDYRNYLILRMVSSFGIMSTPFYVPYAMDRIGVEASTIGLYTSAGAMSAVVSNVLWAYVGEKYGSKYLIIVNSFLVSIVPILATSTRFFQQSHQAAIYALVFIIIQAAFNGRGVGYMTFTLNMAPSLSRPTYLGFLNTMLFPLSFIPVLAGILLKFISYETMFVFSAVLSFISVYFATRLSNVDKSDDIESKDCDQEQDVS
ncbi:MFS transporter [Candidatus Poribacteria bacterium]|nr:MFS transporter [Candidatus Poribacteria bacterium]